jgi:hypothetical protein
MNGWEATLEPKFFHHSFFLVNVRLSRSVSFELVVSLCE